MAMGFVHLKVTGDRNNSDGMTGENTQKIGSESANADNFLDFGVKGNWVWISTWLHHSCVTWTDHLTSLSCGFFTHKQE